MKGTTESAYPIASTIPFPYESPYDVQRDLMSAILEGLRHCQETVTCPKNENKTNDIIPNNHHIVERHDEKRRAPVLMVESPTGTGKSLSLACASMAWLRFCETSDLTASMEQVGTDNENATMTNCIDPEQCFNSDGKNKLAPVIPASPPSASSDRLPVCSSNSAPNYPSNRLTHASKYDWLVSWKPANPDDLPQQLYHSAVPQKSGNFENGQPEADVDLLSRRVSQHALACRAALDVELNGIRARLDRIVNISGITTTTTKCSDRSNTSLKEKQKTPALRSRDQERVFRENLARSGVASALAKERKKSRHRGRQAKQRQVSSVRRVASGIENHEGVEKEDEFLVAEYRSDEEIHDSLSSDSDHDLDAENKENKGYSSHLQADISDGITSRQVSKSEQLATASAKDLLDGGNLDGSSFWRTSEPSRSFKSTRYCVNSNSSTNEKVVGGVQPGTGLRKVIYAARTHSQLSQFVSELRRTHWGDTAKVIALGSRSLLCGNEEVLHSTTIDPNKRSHKNRRSEAEIMELCLDMQKSKAKDSAVQCSAEDNGLKKEDKKSEGRVTAKGIKRKHSGSSCSTADKSMQQKLACPLLVSSEAISTLAMHMLARPSDIEDVASLGKTSHACSYYASREALAAAEVVVLPYNTLLSPEARHSVGLSVKNALIVIDEAHNLPETLRSISSCHLSLPVAEAALSQLLTYTRRYTGRLAGRNLFYLGQIRRCLLALIKYLKNPPSLPTKMPPVDSMNTRTKELKSDEKCGALQKREMMSATELMFALKLDNVNLFSILRYLEKSRLPQKLLGFVNQTICRGSGASSASTNSILLASERKQTKSVGETENKAEFLSKHVSSLSIVENFFQQLTTTQREGKIIVEWPYEGLPGVQQQPTFRFVRIHAASQLNDILEEAHAVVLAGGTLRPFSHIASELFSDDDVLVKAASNAELEIVREYDSLPIPLSLGCTPTSPRPSFVCRTPRLTAFTCGHVIPPQNVITLCLSFGPTFQKLDFRHTSRSSEVMIDELGRTLLNLCNVVPSGLAVFLPSYSYESQVFQRWTATGMLSQLDRKKKVYREPKSSRDLETTLANYSDEVISSRRGAILVSVIGGKMSEGINFANEMARCVMLVGLPYPDITDPVLQEKMRSLDEELRSNSGFSGISGQAYYHNLCMRSVNQSIGRAIRHANDFAAIVLADFRYATEPKIWRSLPLWLKGGCSLPSKEDATFGKVLRGVRSFFAGR